MIMRAGLVLVLLSLSLAACRGEQGDPTSQKRFALGGTGYGGSGYGGWPWPWPDAGPGSGYDAGNPYPDAGGPGSGYDAGQPVPDAGWPWPWPDAGPSPDAGGPGSGYDAGYPYPDSSYPYPDAGVPPYDGPYAPPDAPRDGGHPPDAPRDGGPSHDAPRDGGHGHDGPPGTIPYDGGTGRDSWWEDTDGVDPELAGCHIEHDRDTCGSEANPGRHFGELCQGNFLIETNPRENECHKHGGDMGHPYRVNCDDWCRNRYAIPLPIPFLPKRRGVAAPQGGTCQVIGYLPCGNRIVDSARCLCSDGYYGNGRTEPPQGYPGG